MFWSVVVLVLLAGLASGLAAVALIRSAQARDIAIQAADSVPLKSEVRELIAEMNHVLEKQATQLATAARQRQRQRERTEDAPPEDQPSGERVYSKAELRQLAARAGRLS